MGPNFTVHEDSESQAYFKREQAGDERSPIPAEVDQGGLASTVDGGTSIPSQVDRGAGYSRTVDRG